MLKINNLHARIGKKSILNGIDLEINPGEVHAIMGPNGSGKSTLASVIAGKANHAKLLMGAHLYNVTPCYNVE